MKLIQIFWRFIFKIKFFLFSFTPDRKQKINLKNYSTLWNEPKWGNINCLIDDWKFKFLNKELNLAKHQWMPNSVEKLWKYNLHYFDYLFLYKHDTLGDLHLNKLIESWISNNAKGSKVSWDPYPLSLRLVNWSKWHLSNKVSNSLFSASMHQQASFLSKNIEYHIQGNHLLANAKALIFSGAILGRHGIKYLKKGKNLLFGEINKQILQDGAHFELSPMYHSIILNDFYDLIQLSNIEKSIFKYKEIELIKKITRRMLFWIREMSHLDGKLSYFNDSVEGIAKSFEELSNYHDFLGLGLIDDDYKLFDYSGFGILNNETNNIKCIFDMTNIMSSFQPGHSHADSLSFECSINKEKIITNLGISTYQDLQKRFEERSTHSHSTVEINEKNSTETWHFFRVGRRARVFEKAFNEKENYMIASHDGYRHLKGKPNHTRKIQVKDQSLIVTDNIQSESLVDVIKIFFHLTPNCKVKILDSYSCIISSEINKLLFESTFNPITLIERNYCNSFGNITKTNSVCISLTNFRDLENKVRISIQ